MIMPQSKKSYLCVPIGLGLPCIFFVLTGVCVYSALWARNIAPAQNDVVLIFYTFAFLSLLFAVVLFEKAVWRVEVYQDSIVCKGLMPHHTFSLEYEKCTIGMDWHKQNGNKIWWIYLCYGYKPTYQSKNPANRINAMKCQPGFIRIMFSEEVYDALLLVLPRKQRIALETSRRCAGFDKQGKII